MASSAAPPNPPDVLILGGGATGIGEFTIPPPTFLERWGVVFVSVSGIWMLGICIATLWFYLAHLSFPPSAIIDDDADRL